MKKFKNTKIIKNVSFEEGLAIVDYYTSADYTDKVNVYTWCNGLIDNHIIYDIEQKQAIILHEQYKNCYSSDYEVIATSENYMIDYFFNMYYNYLEYHEILEELETDNTITYLEETGRIPLEYIDNPISVFIDALEDYTGQEYKVYNDLKGQYIARV